MGKTLKGIGVGVAGLAALGGSFVLGRGTSPEAKPASGISAEAVQQVIGLRDKCASTVIEFATAEFPIAENKVETPNDESNDSLQAQTEAGQAKVDIEYKNLDIEYKNCFEGGLEALGFRFDEITDAIDKASVSPKFTPELPIETEKTEG